MPTVKERLGFIEEERNPARPLTSYIEKPEQIHAFVDDTARREEESGRAVKNAREFLRLSGVKLVLMEMNEELLKGKGRIDSEVNEDIESFWYYTGLNLKWKNGILSPDYFMLAVRLYGDLKKMGNSREHHKTIDIDLMESNDRHVPGSSPPPFNNTYEDHFFSVERPTASDLQTVKTWTEANIANFLKQKEQVRGRPIF